MLKKEYELEKKSSTLIDERISHEVQLLVWKGQTCYISDINESEHLVCSVAVNSLGVSSSSARISAARRQECSGESRHHHCYCSDSDANPQKLLRFS